MKRNLVHIFIFCLVFTFVQIFLVLINIKEKVDVSKKYF